MTGGDEKEDARGWSVVFRVEDNKIVEETTESSPKRKKKPSADPFTERTVIDRSSSGKILSQLAAARKRIKKDPDAEDEEEEEVSEETLDAQPVVKRAPRDTDPEDLLSFSDATGPATLT